MDENSGDLTQTKSTANTESNIQPEPPINTTNEHIQEDQITSTNLQETSPKQQSNNPNQEIQKRPNTGKKFILIFLILFIVLILIGVGNFASQKYLSIGDNQETKVPTTTIAPTVVPTEEIEQEYGNTKEEVTQSDDWNIPDLPNGYDWQEIKLGKDESESYRMFWNTTGADATYGDTQFPTTLYFVDLNFDNVEEIIEYHDFASKFIEGAVSNGWDYSVLYDNKRISGTAADGVFGSIYGIVRIKDDKIRSLGYSYNLHPTSWEGLDSEVICPCRLHLEIFVGDEVDLENI